MAGFWKRAGKPAAVVAAVLLLWELLVRQFDVPSWLLPAPSGIWQEGVKGFGGFLPHMGSTIWLAVAGFVIGCSIGIAAAVLLHLLPGVREAVYPLLILTQNVPIIVLAPLLVIWFGFGMLPKLIVITLVCFFPVTIAALSGLNNPPPEMKHYMMMAGASKQQVFSKLEWPNAMPSLFSGLRISATYSVMGAVISEWLGAKKGIGVYMTLASSSFRTERVFVAIIAIMILSLLFFGVIVLAERYFAGWRKKGDE